MKLWLKTIIGILLGIILGITIPKDISFFDRLFKLTSNISINFFLFLTILYVLIKTYLGFYGFKKNKLPGFKITLFFSIFTTVFILISILSSIAFMNITLFQLDDISIKQTQAESIKTFTFSDIIYKIINQNLFTAFVSNIQFILPIIFISFLFGYASFYASKKALIFIEVTTSFNDILQIIVNLILDIYPIATIFIIANLFRQNIFTENELSFILKPISAILVTSLTLSIAYTIVLFFIFKKDIFKYYLGIFGACLMGLVSGNTAAAIMPLNEHLKNNVGIKEELSDSLTPISIILNKSGTIIVATVSLITIILIYSQNLLNFAFILKIVGIMFAFSFLLDGINELGFIAILSMILNIQELHLEQNGYILFLFFYPILSRVGIFFDIFITSIFMIIVSKLTNNIEQKNISEFI